MMTTMMTTMNEGLEDVFDISHVYPGSGVWVEHMTADGSGTVTTLVDELSRIEDGAVSTEWKFEADNPGPRARVAKKHVEASIRGHRSVASKDCQGPLYR